METRPDIIIPNWATDIRSSETGPANASAPVMDTMAAIYEKLEP